MSEHRQFEELVALYALDALDAADEKRLESHLASGCNRCAANVNESRRVSDALLTLVTPTTPSDAVRARLMERARMSDSDPRVVPSRIPAWLGLTAAAAVIAAIALGIYAQSLSDALDDAIAAREATEVELSRLSDALSAVTSPQNRAVSLAGLDAAPTARATAFLDPDNRRLFLYVENLPALPPDRTYQIWLLVDGAPVSVGTFDVGPDGKARLDGEPLPPFQGDVSVAVTVEPEGGVPQPTGPMVLLGS